MTTTLTPEADAKDVPAPPILNPSNPGTAAPPVDPPGNPDQKEPPKKHPEAPVEPPSEKKEGVSNRDAKSYLDVLKLPAASKLETADLERIAAIASAQGLSNEAAQAYVETLDQVVASKIEATLASHSPGGAEWTKTVEGWRKDAENNPNLGKTPDERKQAIQKGVNVLTKFGEVNPEGKARVVKFLNDTGMGDHPDVVEMFAFLGKAMSETPLVKGDAPAGQSNKTLAETLYGNKYDEKPAA